MDTLTLNPQIVGQAENAHGAIMNLVLAGTGLDRDRWVTLSLTMSNGGTIGVTDLTGRVTSALKITPDTAQAALAALVATGLVAEPAGQDGQVTATGDGRAQFASIRGAMAPILERAYGGVAAEDLATAARVLVAITAGLNRELVP